MNYKLYFGHAFTNEKILGAIDEMDQALEKGIYEGVDIYFSSPGGQIDLLIMFAEYLHNYPLQVTIKVIEQVASAGMFLLMMCPDMVELYDTANGMLHMHSQGVDLRELRDKTSMSYMLANEKDTERFLLDIMEPYGISEESMEEIKNGRDVYFTNKELKALFIHRAIGMSKDTIVDLEADISSIHENIKVLEDAYAEMIRG